jgi:PAS domain-containing protein
MTEQQMSAMIDAAVREAVDRTTRELTSKFEAETAGLRRNRDDLLAEKKTGEGKKPWQALLDDADAMNARIDETLRKAREENARWASKRSDPNLPSALQRSGEVTISRDDARNGAKYREAKEAAERAGVPLRILDDAPVEQRTASPVKFLHDETAGVLFANRELVAQVGLPRLNELAASKQARLNVFRSEDDLPANMAKRHAEVIASGDRDAMLDGGSQ